MTVDLACLVVNALWGLALVMIEITGKTRVAGAAWNAGNREQEPEVPPWIERAGRALSNHKENFPLFLTAVVVVHLAHESDRVSATAAIVYVLARGLHGLLYLGGVKGLRSVAHIVGLGATLVILSRLVL
ncbi:MAG: MAPEG family protein [Labilithrix sp.]|nr:MAPEG family protein [Labilithrix sp.]